VTDDNGPGVSYSVWARSTYGPPEDSVWGGAPTNYAGFFLGDMFVSGCIINQCADSNFTVIGSARNIDGDSALLVLSQVQPQHYLNRNPSPLIGLPPGEHMGFSATNWDTIPWLHPLVRTIYRNEEDTVTGAAIRDTFKALTYGEVTPLLVAGVNELKSRAGLWKLSGSNVSLDSTSWNVGIGTSLPTAKLHVENDTLAVGAFISTTRTDSTLLATNIGAYGNSTGAIFGVNVGVHGVATNTTSMFAINRY